MSIAKVVPILKVSQILAARSFYSEVLGFVVDFSYAAGPDGPFYLGVSLDGHQLHLSTFAGDSVQGTAVYFYVDDVDALYRRFLQRGFRTPANPDSPVEAGPVEQTWGMREFYVKDPDGNTLRFGSSIS